MNATQALDDEAILLADDEASIRQLYGMVLKASFPDLTILTAESGEEAVEQFKRHGPFLIFMDLHMPGMGGREAFLEIENECTRNQRSMPAIIFCTGFESPDVSDLASRAPHGKLIKPATIHQLVDEVALRRPGADETR